MEFIAYVYKREPLFESFLLFFKQPKHFGSYENIYINMPP